MDNVTPKEEKREEDNQGCKRGENGTTQGTVDTLVNNPFHRHFAGAGSVFSDSVKYNDCVIEGVSDDGQQCGNNGE